MLDLKKLLPEDRNDLAFQLVVAMRDTINIAKKKGYKSTYENAIQQFHDFSPELYSDIVESLPQRNLSEDAKVYIAKAEAKSLAATDKITPLELLDEDINELRVLIAQNAEMAFDQKKILKQKILSLESLRKSLKPRTLSEHRILSRDASRADRNDFGAQFISGNDFFVDYKITDEKFLRIRLLHPDQAEHMTGADLIYEQHDEERGLIRILFLQYKIWDNGVLYFSQAKNLKAQVEKLESCVCQNKYCSPPSIATGYKEYRYPYCSAFVRPTDKLQNQHEKLVSSGVHIPICTMIKHIKDGYEKIDRKQMRFDTLNHELFEQLFNRGFIGSQWFEQETIEDFYKKYKILESDESVIFYAREVKEAKKDNSSEELDF